MGWAWLALVPWCPGVVQSQSLPLARLATVFPPGAAAGTTNLIQFTGADLEDPVGVRFSDPRVTGRPSETNPAVFVVTVPDTVPPGMLDVRWYGRFGISNPKGFSISPTPELLTSGTNSRPASAMDLPLDTVVNGRVNANDVAWFRVPGRAHQRLRVVVESRELDSRLEPILKWASNEGRPIDSSRRGWIEVTPPNDGPFLVGLHDVTFRGGDEFVYRLRVTTSPQVDFAIPLVLSAGATNPVTLFGRNLPGGVMGLVRGADGGPLEQVSVDVVVPAAGKGTGLPAGAARRPASAILVDSTLAWRWKTTNGPSNEILFTVTTNSVVAAVTNGWVELIPPVEFSSLFPDRVGGAGVRFPAKKDEVLWLEVFADRLGFPCDASVVVQREGRRDGGAGGVEFVDVMELGELDTNLGGIDCNTASRDCAGRFVAPEDGVYRVLIRDLFHNGPTAPQFPYHLSVRRETPDFGLVAVIPQPPRQNDNDRAVHTLTPFLRRGETQVIKVLALRRDGLGGDIELDVQDLPAGVTAATVPVTAGQNVGYVILTAAVDRPVEDRLFSPRIRGRVQGKEGAPWRGAAFTVLSRPIPDSNDQAIPVRFVRESQAGMSPTEFAPVTVKAATNALQAVTNGKLAIPVEAVRRGEFAAAVQLKPFGRAEWDKVKPVPLPEKATNAILEFDLADAKLPEGTYTLWLQGNVAGKYRNNPEALAAAESELKSAEDALKSATDADKPGLETRKKQAEEKRKAAEEHAKPRDATFVVCSSPMVVRILPTPPAPKP